MIIDEAIEILTLDKTCDFEGNAKDLEDAIQLGIEALKEIKHLHESQVLHDDELLLGETKD